MQKSGDSIRVNVQLIKAASDSHIWADTFDRKLTDIFSVESDIASAIADQLRVRLTGREQQIIVDKPTENSEAYNAYLRGLVYNIKSLDTAANTLGAQKYLREAVRLDPKFAFGLGTALLCGFAWLYLPESSTHSRIAGRSAACRRIPLSLFNRISERRCCKGILPLRLFKGLRLGGSLF